MSDNADEMNALSTSLSASDFKTPVLPEANKATMKLDDENSLAGSYEMVDDDVQSNASFTTDDTSSDFMVSRPGDSVHSLEDLVDSEYSDEESTSSHSLSAVPAFTGLDDKEDSDDIETKHKNAPSASASACCDDSDEGEYFEDTPVNSRWLDQLPTFGVKVDKIECVTAAIPVAAKEQKIPVQNPRVLESKVTDTSEAKDEVKNINTFALTAWNDNKRPLFAAICIYLSASLLILNAAFTVFQYYEAGPNAAALGTAAPVITTGTAAPNLFTEAAAATIESIATTASSASSKTATSSSAAASTRTVKIAYASASIVAKNGSVTDTATSNETADDSKAHSDTAFSTVSHFVHGVAQMADDYLNISTVLDSSYHSLNTALYNGVNATAELFTAARDAAATDLLKAQISSRALYLLALGRRMDAEAYIAKAKIAVPAVFSTGAQAAFRKTEQLNEARPVEDTCKKEKWWSSMQRCKECRRVTKNRKLKRMLKTCAKKAKAAGQKCQ